MEHKDKPIFCMGYLNNIMHPSEKCGPGHPNLPCIDNICALIKQCGLINLGCSGPAYTWTNKRFTTTPFERLDCCLADADWCQVFPNTTQPVRLAGG
jgi:hypothetical protein